jgi:uridine kinase
MSAAIFHRAIAYLYDRKGVSKLGVLSSPIFLGVLSLKLLFSLFFSSHFLAGFFAPFVNYYVSSGFANPYDYFSQLHILSAFPYPSVMLWMLAVPRVLFAPFLSADVFAVSHLHLFLYRLPLLFADIVIFIVLSRWLKTKQDKVLYYYWCSPILFYISYIHGQLDAIPVMLLFVFLYFLFKEAFFSAFLFLAFAISAKTSIAIVFPFAVVYLFLKRVDIRRIILFSSIPLAAFAVLNAPFLLSSGFIQMVLKTKEQLKVFDFNYRFSDSFVIYFVPLAYLALFMRSLMYRTFNRDIFLMFLGFSFGILTLFIPPMQGWYFWVVPFLIYFYIKQENAPKFTFVLLNVCYFAYFLVVKNSDFSEVFQPISSWVAHLPTFYSFLVSQGIDADIFVNVVFTLLQTALLLNILWVYKRGIESNVQHKIAYQSYLIGIAGDSGSGKNTFAQLLSDCFGDKNVLSVEGDDLHKWERGDASWASYTHLNPHANRLHSEVENALSLKEGSHIERSFYDHKIGRFTLPQKLSSKRVAIFQGLHSLYLDTMRGILDLKIFLEPSPDLQLHWKVRRDMRDRGHTREKVLEQIKAREGDAVKYIRSQEPYADITVSFFSDPPIQNPGSGEEVNVFLKLKFKNNLSVDGFLRELAKYPTLAFRHYFDGNSQYLEFRGDISKENIDWVAYDLLPELWEVTEGEPRWSAGYNGLIQLFSCYYIFRKMKSDDRIS